MVTVNSTEQVRVIERSPEKLNPVATQQVNDILEGAVKKPAAVGPETRSWAYRVPFTGVRYYSFE